MPQPASVGQDFEAGVHAEESTPVFVPSLRRAGEDLSAVRPRQHLLPGLRARETSGESRPRTTNVPPDDTRGAQASARGVAPLPPLAHTRAHKPGGACYPALAAGPSIV